MEFKKLKLLLRFGNKFLNVTIKDGSIKKGQFVSYKAEKDNPELVEQINLYDGGEVSKILTDEIEEIEVIS